MTLLCAETGRDIEYPTRLYAATREDVNCFSALCSAIVDRIPDSLRQRVPGDGIDIHKATSNGPTSMGAYALSGFTLGEFVFCITRETAEEYLPQTLRALD